jgi:hypothetical protein
MAGMALLAGCSGGDGADPTTTTATTAAGDPAPTTDDDAAPRFEVTGVEPETDAIVYGEEYSVTLTVENTGDAAGQFWGEVVEQRGSMWQPVAEMEFELAPGDPVSESCSWYPSQVGTVEYGIIEVRTDRLLAQQELAVEAPVLSMGEPFADPTGWEMTVEGVELHDEVQATDDNGETVTAAAPTNMQWALLTLSVENPSEESVAIPPRRDIYLLAGGEQIQETELVEPSKYGAYVTPTQQPDYFTPPSPFVPNAVESGWMWFAVPADVTAADIDSVVYWEENDVRITWE